MNINDINGYNNFLINGKWGFEQNNLKYSGVLSYDENGINLNLLNLTSFDKNKHYNIYGTGILSADGEETLVQCISLLDCYISRQGFSFHVNNPYLANSLAQSRQLFISDEYINDESEFDNVCMVLTNISQWLNGLVDEVGKYDNSDMIDNISNENIEIKINEKKVINNSNTIISRTVGNDFTDYISVNSLNGRLLKANEIDKYKLIIEEYFSLVTNSGQHILKDILCYNNHQYFYFQPKRYTKAIEKTFFQEFHYIPRNKVFLDAIVKSLLEWVNSFDTLSPIYASSLYLFNNGTLDQQLASVLSGIDLIYSEYFNNSSNKRISFGFKVFIILNSLNSNIIDEVLKTFPLEKINCDEKIAYVPKKTSYHNKEKLRQFCERAREIRNSTAHGSSKYSKVKVDGREKYKFKLACQFIVREWLLNKLCVPSEIINKELNIPDYLPSNFDLIWNID